MRLEPDQIAAIHHQLVELRQEHRDLDHAIGSMHDGPYIDELRMRRLKKRKLSLKDQITRLESMLIPDEPA
ncbi:MAG: YdcH family protein [Gammaproteobacteria bacterium]